MPKQDQIAAARLLIDAAESLGLSGYEELAEQVSRLAEAPSEDALAEFNHLARTFNAHDLPIEEELAVARRLEALAAEEPSLASHLPQGLTQTLTGLVALNDARADLIAQIAADRAAYEN